MAKTVMPDNFTVCRKERVANRRWPARMRKKDRFPYVAVGRRCVRRCTFLVVVVSCAVRVYRPWTSAEQSVCVFMFVVA